MNLFIYFVGFILGICALVSTRSIAEPQCSPYEFFERTIEKVVRVEHSNELTKEKNKQLESRMDKQWREKEEFFSGKFEQIEGVMKNIDDFKEKVMTTFTDYKANVQALLERQETDLQNYKELGSLHNPIVVFKAKDATVSSHSVGDVIVFPTVVMNEGSGYDSSTGVFTAPVHGLYLFTVQFCLGKDKDLRIRILADEEIIAAALYRNYEKVGSCYTSDGFAVLEKGKQAKVALNYKGSGSIIWSDKSQNYFWTSFSGVLIQARS